jgi:hypothetical protein
MAAVMRSGVLDDLWIGIEWMSPHGKRWVARREGDRLFLATEGSPSFEIVRESDIDRQIQVDESQMRRCQSASAEAEAQVAKIEEKRGLHGFTASMPAVKARKIEETLDRQQGFSGRLMPRRVFAEGAVESGAVVALSPKGDRRLVFPDGSFFAERDVTKIVLDYVDFMVRRLGHGR